MKDITDTTYYKIDTEAFEYSPYAPVSEEKVKLSRKYWKSQPEEEYYDYMCSGIKDSIALKQIMFEPITTEILDTFRHSIFSKNDVELRYAGQEDDNFGLEQPIIRF